MKPEQIHNWTGKFIDVRDFDEFLSARLEQAQCVPQDRLLSEANKWSQSEQILLICTKGERSAESAKQLEQAGFTQIYMVEGGMDACKKARLDIIVERKSIPMLRQVLMAAGIVLLIGLGLSLLNPWFLIIPWFASVMLVMAGVTGFCPMMKFLKLMPWNAKPACSTDKCSKG
jgi:rhodanese-related sulfurtransferase